MGRMMMTSTRSRSSSCGGNGPVNLTGSCGKPLRGLYGPAGAPDPADRGITVCSPRANTTSIWPGPERICGYRSGRPQVAPPLDRRRSPMRGRKNPPLDLTPVPDGTPLTFDTMARAYLEDYELQRYRTMSTARPRVEHLRGFFGGWVPEAMTADSVRRYQLHRRKD